MQFYSDAFLTVATPDLARLVAFYQVFLAQTPVAHQRQVFAEFRLGGVRLVLFQPKPENQPEFAQPLGAGLSLCLEVESLDGAIAQFRHAYDSLQIRPKHPWMGPIITASHGREVYAYDPDGNRLILHQSPPASGP